MALWGKTDALVSAPKYIAPTRAVDMTAADEVAANVITHHGHGFITADPVTYTSAAAATNLASGTIYYAIRLTADTFSLATSAVNAAVPTPIVLTNDGAAADTFQKTPSNLYFVDYEESQQAENQARGLIGPGWWLYETYTDAHGVVRHKTEQLVPMVELAADAGDRTDDLVLVDYTITITSTAQDPAGDITAPAAVNFDTVATVSPVGGALTYQWQVDTGGGFGNVTDGATGGGGNYAGATSTQLVIDDSTGLDTYQYRVVVSVTGGTDVTSDALTLTVV
jgi:hypothetical protein